MTVIRNGFAIRMFHIRPMCPGRGLNAQEQAETTTGLPYAALTASGTRIHGDVHADRSSSRRPLNTSRITPPVTEPTCSGPRFRFHQFGASGQRKSTPVAACTRQGTQAMEKPKTRMTHHAVAPR
jgi:hypothetical protein